MAKEKEAKLEGKKVKVTTDSREFHGHVLESYDPDIVLLKLDSGYNIGIEKSRIKKVVELATETKKFEVKELKFKQGLPEVPVIVTGGTISSRVDYRTGAVKPLTRPEDIITVAPKLSEIIRPVIESPFMIFSENITSEHWKKLAMTVEKQLNKPLVKGVIILAGTDTLHYIASALSFMLSDLNKPVILTCSQRSIDRGSSDAMLNLTCSAYLALSDIAEVMIVSHGTTQDNFCFALRGTKVRKMHTSRRDTFRPINTKPIAVVYDNGKIEELQEHNKRDEKKKAKANTFFEDKVALIKWYPNLSPDILDFYIKNKYKGIVIEATGFGHVAIEGKFSWFDKIKEATKKMTVCFACQTLYGSLDPFVYAPGRMFHDAGVIFLKDILPETAYVKLGYLLGKEKDMKKVKEMMLKNLAREFNPRISEGDFLV